MQLERSIGIIGGGPGGLTLARLLLTRGIPATVFELDEHPLARPQGGSLDLHAGSGQRALREAGLEARFKALARYDDQYDAVYDPQGVLHFEFAGEHGGPQRGPDGDRPEIDRTQLRSLLLDSLPAGAVRWGSKITAVEPTAGGRHRVIGEQGALGEFDLVVGADGAWSKVRPLVSAAAPAYTGVVFIELQLDEVDARHPEIAALVPRGKVSVVGRSQGLIAQRSSNGHVRAYFMFRTQAGDEQRARGLVDLSSPAAARTSLRALLPGWAPALLRFIEVCSDTISVRPIVALPVGHSWLHRPGVTLLGDAAHVMPPFSGEGVNMAMLDALELALRLAEHPDWSAAVAGYEEQMFRRAAEAAADAVRGLDFVSDDALAHVLEHFRSIA
jgi:2-polyprenyl-6-methoxyphenol hydroxylase-like FAD-dependent oxidoreductase